MKLDQELLPLILAEVEHEGDLEETKYQWGIHTNLK